MGTNDKKKALELAREYLLDAIEQLADLGWGHDQIRAEVEYGLTVAEDDGLLIKG